MALPGVTFTRQDGNLARPLPGFDHISGLAFPVAGPTPAFSSNVALATRSLKDAEDNLGIDKANFPVAHYHISEFFRINPGSKLWVRFGITEATLQTDMEQFQIQAGGEIRQIGAFLTDEFTETQVQALEAAATTLQSQKKPCSFLLAANLVGHTTITTLGDLPDLRALTSPRASVVIGEDAGLAGAALATVQGNSITTLGATLGAVSAAQVQQSIAARAQFNMVTAGELDEIRLAEGTRIQDVAQSELEAIDSKGYIFLMKEIGLVGSFHNGQWTASMGDFDTIARNRVIDKIFRNVGTFVVPLVGSNVFFNDDGTLTPASLDPFESAANRALEQIERENGISGYAINIDPSQDVLNTGNLEIVVQSIPAGIARTFTINAGFSQTL